MFLENLRRMKISAIIAAILILCFEVTPVFTEVMTRGDDPVKTVEGVSSLCFMMPFVAIGAPIVLVMTLFAQFNKRSYSDFAHSLPYTRTCIFVTNTVSVYTVLAGLFALCAVAGMAACAVFPSYYVINLTGFWKMLFTYLSAAAFVTSSLQIAVSVTGTVLSNLTAAGLVLFFPRYIMYIITASITSGLPFMYGSFYLPLLSPRYNTFVGMFTDVLYPSSDIGGIGPIIYTFAVSAVYLVLALILFGKRKSETAEMPAPGKKVQAAIRVLIALVFTIPATAIAVSEMGEDIEVVVILYALGLVAYFAYEIITTRRWKNLVKAIPALFIVVAVSAVCGLSVVGVTNAAGSYCPTANEIDSVRVESSNWRAENNILPNASDVELRDLKTKSIVAEALKNNVEAWKEDKYEAYYISDKYVRCNVAIKENGITRGRYIYLTEEENEELLEAMSLNEEYKKAYMTLPEPLAGTLGVSGCNISEGLDAKTETAVVETMQKEINELGFEKWFSICENGYYYGLESNVLEINYYPAGYSDASVDVTICPEYFPKTFDLILETYFKNQKTDDVKAAVAIAADSAKIEEAENFNIHMELSQDGKYYTFDSDLWESENNKSGKYSLNKAIAELVNDALNENSLPQSDSYMYVWAALDIYDEETGAYVGYYGTCYLPVPDGFNAAENPLLVPFDEVTVAYD